MENKKTIVDPHDEVRKLQDLVRKLEQQNQQLRNKQNQNKLQRNSQESTPASALQLVSAENQCQKEDLNGITQNNAESFLNEVDLIDIEQLELSDEDSWLYESPQLLTPEQKQSSPYEWLRADIEDGRDAELQAAKRALVSRIEELARVSSLYASPPNCVVKRHHLSPDDVSESRVRLSPNPKFALSPSLQKEIDSRTFTRPKKRHTFELPVVDGEILYTISSRDEVSSRTATPPPPLTDVIDIHTIARLQEESLRQSSPPSTPRRNSVASSSSQRSALSPIMTADHDGQEWAVNCTLTATGRESVNDVVSPRAHSSRASSASASPPVSPGSSQYLDEYRVAISGGGKRGLSALAKPCNGLHPVRGLMSQNLKKLNGPRPSDVYGSNDQLSRNHGYSISPSRIPVGTPRSVSPATRTSGSPARNSLPTDDGTPTKSAHYSRIPKPRARSSIPTFSRSRLNNEDSWKDGCF